MKYLALILFFAATSAFAGDSTSVVWTSDSTYVKNGVEYIDIEKTHNIRFYQKENEEYQTVQDKNKLVPNMKWFGYPCYMYWYYHSPDWATSSYPDLPKALSLPNPLQPTV